MNFMRIKGWNIFLFISIGALSPSTHAEIYKWVDGRGNVYFSDKQSSTSRAKPVQLKSSINSYSGTSTPQSETSSAKQKKTISKNNRLPMLRAKQVVMYSTVWCGFCKKAKAYFRKKGISFSEKDIEKSAQAKKEYQSLGGGGVPLILVGNKKGTRKLSGFSTARFDAAYQ